MSLKASDGGPRVRRGRRCFGLAVAVASLVAGPDLHAQAAAERPVGDPEVTSAWYENPTDGTELSGVLTLPAGPGPHPGVVLLSIAGTRPIVERLVSDGYAVLAPVRRGFVSVEPLLRASYVDLAGDVRAALDHLRDHPRVSGGAIGVVAQADDTPAALISTVAADLHVPLVLLAPPAFNGVEVFRLEQRGLARRDGASAEALRALDEYVAEIARVARGPEPQGIREARLAALRARSPVQLPRNAAFPGDARQAHFLASPLWRDRLDFEPEVALSRLRGSVLVLIGLDDPNTPLEAWLRSVRRGLVVARSPDSTVCLVRGRTRHTFTPESVEVVSRWLGARLLPRTDSTPVLDDLCLPDPPGRRW